MNNQFSEYAQYYDLLYKNKDYEGEAGFVSSLISAWGSKSVEKTKVLDLACGTGRHTREFAKLGYKVSGSDISSEMIEVAVVESNRQEFTNIHYYNESFQNCNKIDDKYDVIVVLFSAINYLTEYKDFSKTMQNIHQLLHADGILIFDFWNGNAVINDFSPLKFKRINDENISILRTSNTSLDKNSQIATVKFDFMLLQSNKVIREFSETHSIRYFFPQEMKDLLAANGFEVVHTCPFFNGSGIAEPITWNLTFVASRCK